MNNLATFLAVPPSTIEGLGRIMDFAGALNQYNASASTEEADKIAMEAEWAAVGDELSFAVDQFGYDHRA